MKKIRLEDIDKKTPFEVPEGYFQKLTVDIQERVSEKPRTKGVFTPQLKWAVSGALVILLAITVIFLSRPETQTVDQLLAQVDDQELIDYLASIDLTDEELALTLDDQDIDYLLEDSYDELDLSEDDLDNLLIDYEYELDNLL